MRTFAVFLLLFHLCHHIHWWEHIRAYYDIMTTCQHHGVLFWLTMSDEATYVGLNNHFKPWLSDFEMFQNHKCDSIISIGMFFISICYLSLCCRIIDLVKPVEFDILRLTGEFPNPFTWLQWLSPSVPAQDDGRGEVLHRELQHGRHDLPECLGRRHCHRHHLAPGQQWAGRVHHHLRQQEGHHHQGDCEAVQVGDGLRQQDVSQHQWRHQEDEASQQEWLRTHG